MIFLEICEKEKDVGQTIFLLTKLVKIESQCTYFIMVGEGYVIRALDHVNGLISAMRKRAMIDPKIRISNIQGVLEFMSRSGQKNFETLKFENFRRV